jgi:hypothetical protein
VSYRMNKVAACSANSETIAMCSYVIINPPE